MFGGWQPAEATIVERRLVGQSHGGDDNLLIAQTYEYLADIRPDDGSPEFRAALEEPFNATTFKQPNVGDVVRVKYKDSARHQPASIEWRRSDVKFDKSDPNLHQDLTPRRADKRAVAEANSPEALEHWEALKSAGPGSSSGGEQSEVAPASAGDPERAALDSIAAQEQRTADQGVAPPDMAASMAELKRAAVSDPAAFRQRMFELRDQMTGGAGGPMIIGGEGLAGLAAIFGSGPGQPSGTGPGQPSGVDPIDQLAKLADLHDRGALSDEEFAAAKAKLLGDG